MKHIYIYICIYIYIYWASDPKTCSLLILEALAISVLRCVRDVCT